MKLRVPALLQAVLVVTGAYLIFDNAFPPLLPQTLMIQFMTITVIGVLLFFSADDDRWSDFKAPLAAVLRRPGLWPVRWLLLVLIPGALAYVTYLRVIPALEAPVELRQVHPAPPSSLKVFGKRYDLKTLENPVRKTVLEQIETDRDGAMQVYADAVLAGSEIYYQNCFFCHGDLLDGKGPYADGFNPQPINFQDVGTIAQLQEAFLFWRIATGGPGLPKEGTPWKSAMPVWHEMLTEDEIWNVITFLYDYVGQVPRMWDPETSKQVTAVKDEVNARRKEMAGKELYAFRCAVCHGEEGAGDGPAADRLYPRPRDFTLGLFKYKTSPGTTPPKDDDLFATIKYGLTGTGMPGWSSLLSDDQINTLIPVIKGFDIAATWSPEDADDEDFDDDGHYLKPENMKHVATTEPIAGQVPYSADSVAKGRTVFEKTCKECHGPAARGNIISGKRLEDDWGNRIWPRDLTKPWTYRVSNRVTGPAEQAQDEIIQRIYRRLSIGIPGTPMPAHRADQEGNKDPIALEDRWHVANYVYSLREKAAPAPGESSLITAARVTGNLPVSADEPAWRQARPTTLRLVPNIIKEERMFTPLADAVTVRALYDEREIVFLLQVDDRTDSRPGEEVSEQIQDENLTLYPDALAMQFPKEDAFSVSPVVEKPLFRHGDAAHGTTIWYWNAGSVEPAKAGRASLLDASGPDSKLAPRTGEGSLRATGAWRDGRWSVVMRRPRDDSAAGDVVFDEGRFIPVSFANWDGSNGETGSKHTLTSWYWLLLPPEPDPAKVFGMPLGVGLLVFAGGLVLVRRARITRNS